MSAEPIVTLEKVTLGYGSTPVLHEISLSIFRGKFTGLLGANGSGKSTLMRALLGIVPPSEGAVQLHPISGRQPVLGYVPQRDTLDPIYLLSSFEVVLMGASGRLPPGRGPGRAERDWSRECLRETGTEHLSGKQFSQLSGGQKQRVLIARALATSPDFLLLDEPTSGIDAAARQAVMEVLRKVHGQQKLTILMSSHDLPLVRANVEWIIWLHRGQVEQGPTHELLSPQKVEEILDLEMT
jgi:ABC-type Mn2+/Zn2+ transport system ATPase subunit